ncbi:MAG: hypothetical protein ACK6AO_14600, partial [Planctomycetota bacterium]
STRIAERHYLQTTDAHWEKAIANGVGEIQNGGNAGGNIRANLEASIASENAEAPTISGCDPHGFVGISYLVPPQGLEPWTR